MKQVTEDYVSYETAVLLKEKGFDIPCREHYYQYGELSPYATEYDNWNDKNADYFSCPSISLVMKWLREVYKIFISIQQHMDMSYVWYIYEDGFSKGCDRQSHNNTYEVACEAAIKYCLENLIL